MFVPWEVTRGRARACCLLCPGDGSRLWTLRWDRLELVLTPCLLGTEPGGDQEGVEDSGTTPSQVGMLSFSHLYIHVVVPCTFIVCSPKMKEITEANLLLNPLTLQKSYLLYQNIDKVKSKDPLIGRYRNLPANEMHLKNTDNHTWLSI